MEGTEPGRHPGHELRPEADDWAFEQATAGADGADPPDVVWTAPRLHRRPTVVWSYRQPDIGFTPDGLLDLERLEEIDLTSADAAEEHVR